MELMWIFTNTLQLIYYISVVNVNFPDIVNVFFPYVQICNANNQYVSELSYMIIPSSKFESGYTVFGQTAFYVNCSDKIPWLIPIVILFCFVKSTDYCNPKENKKCFRLLLKVIGKLKYDFFLRLSIELELDIAFNAILNIYFYNFSSIYEVISFILAIYFMLFLCASVIFSAYFILTKRKILEEKPESLESFSCLFCEIKFRNELASYSILIYFVRRLYFCIGLIIFYKCKNVQLLVLISSALVALIYTIWARPYKETILNIFSIFGELCFILISSLCYYFDEIKIDETTNSTTTSEQTMVGYAVVGVVGIFIIVNVLYLLPVKIFEICRLVKRIFVYIYDKVKLLFKTKPPVLKQSADGSIYSGDPTISSAINLNRPSIQVVPKQYYMYQERKNRKLNKSIITEFSFRGNSQQANFNINEEEKVPGSRESNVVPSYENFTVKRIITNKVESSILYPHLQINQKL